MRVLLFGNERTEGKHAFSFVGRHRMASVPFAARLDGTLSGSDLSLRGLSHSSTAVAGMGDVFTSRNRCNNILDHSDGNLFKIGFRHLQTVAGDD